MIAYGDCSWPAKNCHECSYQGNQSNNQQHRDEEEQPPRAPKYLTCLAAITNIHVLKFMWELRRSLGINFGCFCRIDGTWNDSNRRASCDCSLLSYQRRIGLCWSNLSWPCVPNQGSPHDLRAYSLGWRVYYGLSMNCCLLYDAGSCSGSIFLVDEVYGTGPIYHQLSYLFLQPISIRISHLYQCKLQ